MDLCDKGVCDPQAGQFTPFAERKDSHSLHFEAAGVRKGASEEGRCIDLDSAMRETGNNSIRKA